MDVDRVKTTMCKNWRQGTCDRGTTCGFAHGSQELSRLQLPEGKNTGPPACRDVLMGTCKWGNYCSYNHNIEVLNRTYFDEYGLDNMMPLEHKQQIIREANGKGSGRRGPFHEWTSCNSK